MKYNTYTVDELALLISNFKIVLKVQRRNRNFPAVIKTAMALEAARNELASR